MRPATSTGIMVPMTTTDRIKMGYYLLQSDSPEPRSIAKIVLGDGMRYPELVKANPELWMKGDRLMVQGRPGIATVVEKGEQAMDVLRRIHPSDARLHLEQFFLWNGGPHYVLEELEVVFIPER